MNETARGIVAGISINGTYGERLRGMGFFPGREIQIVRKGSPIIVEICGGRIAVAREIADAIEVDALPAEVKAPAAELETSPTA